MFYNDYNLAVAERIYVEKLELGWGVFAEYLGKDVLLEDYITEEEAKKAKTNFQMDALK